MSVIITIILYVLTSILSNPYALSTQHEYDVIIMGAGSSGIGAAKSLFEANITNILIIEAQWYIGGRTAVHYFSDYMLNIGASWISGVCITPSLNCSHYNETNPMLTAAYKYNISFVASDYSSGIILDFGGNEHNKTNTNNIHDTFSSAMDCTRNIMQNKSYDMSYSAALHLCNWSKPHNAIDKTIQWLNFEFDYSEHAKWVSATDHWHGSDTYNKYGPDSVFITDPRGYQGIIKALANEFLDIDNIDNEEKIILNSPITKIEYDINGVSGVTVTLDEANNNTQYSAKYAIVTFSIGVLQSDIVEFVPQLPSWKIDALLGWDFIDYIIVLVKWPYNFWSDIVVNNSEFIILNDDRFGFFPWIYNLDHPKLYNGSLIWRFDITLDLAQMVQYQNINDTIKQIIDLKLSHYFDNVPDPNDVFVASWQKNKYIQGSYGRWPVHFSYDSKEAMRWPIKQRLFFTGEGMGDNFVHGAWIHGVYTANQILSCMGYDNGLECPSEYIPSFDDIDCKTIDESFFKQLLWLWIVIGVVFGIILGYLFAKYYTSMKPINIAENKGVIENNYGSVTDDDVRMNTM